MSLSLSRFLPAALTGEVAGGIRYTANAYFVKRRPVMDCPVCKVAMITCQLEEVEIDYCLDCAGIWLDAGELEALLDDTSRAKDLLASFKPAKKCTEKPRKCPICLKTRSSQAFLNKGGKIINFAAIVDNTAFGVQTQFAIG